MSGGQGDRDRAERLGAGAANLERRGADLIAYYLSPGRLPGLAAFVVPSRTDCQVSWRYGAVLITARLFVLDGWRVWAYGRWRTPGAKGVRCIQARMLMSALIRRRS